jgi:DNA-binding transcriptional LysR family regulator
MASFRHYQYAHVLAREGSFKRAALELHVSQPALSKGIAALEEEFGTELFDRTQRPLQPTAAGRLVLQEAERILQGQDGLKQQMMELKGRIGGRLSIAWGPYAYIRFAIPFAEEFRRLHPTMELAYTLAPWDKGPGQVNRGEVDLAVADIVNLEGGKYLLHPLRPLEICLICRRDHPLAIVENIDLPTIFLHRLAACGAPPWARSWLREHMPDFDYRDSPAYLVSDDYFLIRELLLRGELCTLMAAEVFADEINKGTLMARSLPDAPTTHAGIILPESGMENPDMMHYIDLIKKIDQHVPTVRSPATSDDPQQNAVL